MTGGMLRKLGVDAAGSLKALSGQNQKLFLLQQAVLVLGAQNSSLPEGSQGLLMAAR